MRVTGEKAAHLLERTAATGRPELPAGPLTEDATLLRDAVRLRNTDLDAPVFLRILGATMLKFEARCCPAPLV